MKKIFLIALLLLLTQSCIFAQGPTYEEQMYDFGHVGIDFKVQHTFIFVNRTDIPIKILHIDPLCDCTSIRSNDTLVLPGDTAFFIATFKTRNFYGPMNKSFIVTTDHPKLLEIEYFFLSIIGQWFSGMKPNPISLFFLPSKEKQNIQIPNKEFENLSIVSISQAHNYIDSQILAENAKKGNSVKVEIIRNKNLTPGTYYTTVTIVIKADDNENTNLSIPIKLVIYE